ncbi:hypothetical protein ASG95_19395 [Phycicoccus sp. Soil803]|nr:hypothetical protein ASG95_19395 [Phycicoccus sp. Soil803]
MDAGLPVSSELTERLAAALSQRDRTDHDPYGGERLSRIMRAVVAVLSAWDATHGRGVTGPIDVERVYAALHAIRHRDDQEIAPFVSDWSSFLAQEKADDSVLLDLGQALKRAFAEGTHYEVGATVQRAFEELHALKSSHDVFGAVADALLNELPRALHLGDANIDYLAPMWQTPADTVVATLNYDMTVEASAAKCGVPLTTGAERWRGGFSWVFGEGRRLLKLHGSVDWTLVNADDPGRIGNDRIACFPRYTVGDPNAPYPRVVESRTSGAPAVVFGRGNKMRAEGPYTALLVAFEQALLASSNLVVIGYSFRDQHINTVLERWYNADRDGRGLFVVDPGFPSRPRGVDDYAWTVSRRLHDRNPGRGVLRANRGLLRTPAQAGLLELFGAG